MIVKNKIHQKVIFSMFIILISHNSIGQIPNNGFENWTDMGIYNVPQNWGTLNHTTALASIFTATMGSPGSPGATYLKLTSKTIGPSVVSGIAVCGKLDTLTMQPISGFPYSQQPATFTGNWQYMIFGNSPGSVHVSLTRWDVATSQRVTVATINHTLAGMAMSWSNFSLPFNYVDTNIPDSCIIFFRASGNNPTNNDYLWVDNLSFSGDVAEIQSNESFIKELAVFPNPTSENITVKFNVLAPQKIEINIKDLNGKIVYSKNIGLAQGELKRTIDVENFEKGTYLIQIVGENLIESKRIIIN